MCPWLSEEVEREREERKKKKGERRGSPGKWGASKRIGISRVHREVSPATRVHKSLGRSKK